MSRSKQSDINWTPSEDYDSSETSNSEGEDEFANINLFEHQVHESGNCSCQV